MSRGWDGVARYLGLGPAFIACAALGGCQLVEDPFHDEFVGRPMPTTPSVNAARAADARHAEHTRGYAETHAPVHDGRVTHGPLFYEDPIGETASDDGQFAWTGVDYLYWVYGPAYYFVDSVLFGVTVVDTPPWRPLASDGRPARRTPTPGIHDAARMSPPTATMGVASTSDSTSG